MVRPCYEDTFWAASNIQYTQHFVLHQLCNGHYIHRYKIIYAVGCICNVFKLPQVFPSIPELLYSSVITEKKTFLFYWLASSFILIYTVDHGLYIKLKTSLWLIMMQAWGYTINLFHCMGRTNRCPFVMFSFPIGFSYLSLFLQPSTSLMFPAATPPFCLRLGSCCGRWSHTHPPCKIHPVRISAAAQ